MNCTVSATVQEVVHLRRLMQHRYLREERTWLRILVLVGGDWQSRFGAAPLYQIRTLFWARDQEKFPFCVCIIPLTEALIQPFLLEEYNT